MTKRVIETVILLSRRRMSVMDLSERFNIAYKTVRRDISAIEDMGIPVTVTPDEFDDMAESELKAGARRSFYRVDRHWITQFEKRNGVVG